jgi:SAM-dependent MidA family methyltransferase
MAYLSEKVSWHDSIRDIPGFSGCILSNELLDNFSVHQAVMEDELMEVFVDYKNGFVEMLQPAKKELSDYLAELNVVLPKGFRTEINLEATEWIREIATFLEEGYVITIDYGNASSELYSKSKRCGTLLCYHNHSINDSAYTDIGEQDITSHVNFSALCHWGF